MRGITAFYVEDSHQRWLIFKMKHVEFANDVCMTASLLSDVEEPFYHIP